jgi:hypothetical protein
MWECIYTRSFTVFNLDIIWRWVVSFILRPLFPHGNDPRYPLDTRLGRSQSRSGRDGEERSLLQPAGTETPAHILVGIPTELSRLHFSDSMPYDTCRVISFATWICLCRTPLQSVSIAGAMHVLTLRLKPSVGVPANMLLERQPRGYISSINKNEMWEIANDTPGWYVL